MPKGKEEVLCSVCDKKMRKDMIGRHWKTQHQGRIGKGETPGWKFPTRGTNPLENHGFSKHQSTLLLQGMFQNLSRKGKVLQPRVPNLFKLLHLFLKEPVLYSGIQAFLYLYLRFEMIVV